MSDPIEQVVRIAAEACAQAQLSLRDAKNRESKVFKMRSLYRARRHLLRALSDIDGAYIIIGSRGNAGARKRAAG